MFQTKHTTLITWFENVKMYRESTKKKEWRGVCNLTGAENSVNIISFAT